MNAEQVDALVRPLIEAADLVLYDVEFKGATLRVSIDGPEGVPFAALERLSREISLTLDEHDQGGGAYTLEVSTPGVERVLRTPEHFRRAIGEIVTVKTVPLHRGALDDGAADSTAGRSGRRRLRGELLSADDDRLTIDDEAGPVDIAIAEVESARTIFEWGPAPKPGSSPAGSKQRHRSSS